MVKDFVIGANAFVGILHKDHDKCSIGIGVVMNQSISFTKGVSICHEVFSDI